jgi:hypothetical protein
MSLSEMKSVCQRDVCSTMFIVPQFTIAKIWDQPRCLSMDEWIKENIHDGLLLSHKKEWSPVICGNTGGTGVYDKWNKPGTEKQISLFFWQW